MIAFIVVCCYYVSGTSTVTGAVLFSLSFFLGVRLTFP